MIEAYYCDDSVTLYHGDCLDVLAELPDASVDAVVTDPPYGLEFMGKDWDAPWKSDGENLWTTRDKTQDLTGKTSSPFIAAAVNKYRAGLPFQHWCQQWATELLRVLKPGGHLLAFGGTRTWHRLACAVEDAGFEIRDNIAWIYGSGFPKSMDVSKAIDKAAGAEREVVGRKAVSRDMSRSGRTGDEAISPVPVSGTIVPLTAPATPEAQRWQGWGTALKPAFEPIVVARKPLTGTVAANVLAYGTGALNIDACRIPTNDKLGGGSETKGQQMKDGWHRPWMDDPQACANNAARHRERVAQAEELGRWPANLLLDPDTAAELDKQSGISKDGVAVPGAPNAGYGGEGGASRFFPIFRYNPKAATDERPQHNGVQHPTVKPVALMQWLVRLVTPPNGLVLDPFAGSGTTGEAAIHEHKRAILIERESDYLPLIVQRLTKPLEVGFDFG